MSSMLQINITGFVGSAPVVRQVGEQQVASFSVAVNRKTANGEQQTLWVRVSCWQKLSDVAMRYLKSGSHVTILASWMRTNTYLDRDGNAQASLDITADRLVLLDRANGEHAPSDEDEMADVPF